MRVLAEGRLRPRVVVVVDLFGLPADYQAVRAVADRYGLLVLEDGAQAFGGSIQMADQVGHDENVTPSVNSVIPGLTGNLRRACSFGDIATTSFFPAKPLGCYGDGGAVFTDNDEWAALIASYRFHGKGAFKYDNVRIGLNSRLDTVQAAVLKVKLKAFTEYELDAVNRVAACYTELLHGIATPVIPECYRSSWAQYTVRFSDREERDTVQAALKAEGIPAMVYYPKPLHLQTAFADFSTRPSGLGRNDNVALSFRAESRNLDICPVATSLCERVLSLPMHPYMSDQDINTVCTAIHKALL